MVMEVNFVEPENELLVILVTLDGMITYVNNDPGGNLINVVLVLLYKIIPLSSFE
jgi:hypothetical protein